ncbi:ribokinase [Fulvimarina pelagi]|uniref:ribokinase n=1 Tax=Fulvimarina pelagi TaxID=217511 RepID=UPI001FCB1197|nr:ribokinase [Fulvimarina pelagi]
MFGSLNIDLVCRVERIARPGETVLGPSYEQLFGGKGANQAVAAARSAASGISVRMIGAVGPDDFGTAIIANLEANGIDAGSILRTQEPTGAAFIAIDSGGENAITVASGANRVLGADALVGAQLSERTILLLQMESPLDETIAAARRAQEVGGRTILNLAPVPANLTAESLRKLTEAIEWLIVNELELDAAARALDLKAGSITDLASTVGQALDVNVIATLGANGVVTITKDGESFIEPAMSVAIEDTTGAGDTFCGVFAASLAAKLEIHLAVRRATTAASLACRRTGAQTAMPTFEEITAALNAPLP